MYRNLHLSIWLTPALIALVLWLLSHALRAGPLGALYQRHFQELKRERHFLASLAFFVTIVIVRIITFTIHRGIGPLHDVWMRGRHIHHLVWGIFLLLFVGYCWLNNAGIRQDGANNWVGRAVSLTYGMAAALTLDEFALWLNLQDVYWAREGAKASKRFFYSVPCWQPEFMALHSSGPWCEIRFGWSTVRPRECPQPKSHRQA